MYIYIERERQRKREKREKRECQVPFDSSLTMKREFSITGI
jgi:hypothetical protein